MFFDGEQFIVVCLFDSMSIVVESKIEGPFGHSYS